MDDLSGLDWSSAPSSSQGKPAAASYPALRPSPSPSFPSLSGRTTPLSNQPSGPVPNRKIGSKPSTPANDSFSSLLAIGGNKAKAGATGLSLQERQRQLQEEKLRQEAERAKKNGFGNDVTAWESLGGGSGKSTPDPSLNPARNPNGGFGILPSHGAAFASYNARKIPGDEDEKDILAAFDSSAPVDSSSHFPAPKLGRPDRSSTSKSGQMSFDDDDDPFGLSQIPQGMGKSHPAPVNKSGDDDFDILGDLAKPVSELPPKPVAQPAQTHSPDDSSDDEVPVDPRDKAVAEIVDMGFPVEKALVALDHTTDGVDVQAAVGWLLNQAHNESKNKTEQKRGTSESRQNHSRSRDPTSREREQHSDEAVPAWARAGARRQDAEPPAREKDVTQLAQDIGSSLFKSANSLWKTSRKQVQKAVADFQQDTDSSQPKWMRDAQLQAKEEPRKTKAHMQPDRTDEAMMLESGAGRPAGRSETSKPEFLSGAPSIRREPSPLAHSAFPQQRRPPGRITREDIEEQSAQAYVSPARRKQSPVVSSASSLSESHMNARSSGPDPAAMQSKSLASSRPIQDSRPGSTPPARSVPKPASSPLPTRPKAPPRNVPQVSQSSLATSTKQRKLGTEAFKRGDYGSAHELYSRALAPLPSGHPICVIILTNRALTGLKNGDPKSCIVDADAAITIIGVSRGENETITLGPGEDKSMSEFWGKALTRKAEALEAMEKWGDAAKVWREAVEAGVGGSIAIQGRNRCEQADRKANGAASSTRTATPASRKPTTKPPVRPQVSAHKSAEAVKALREANKAAERVDDEKFALVDQVDAKLVAWKGTKADNLRALLGSLDNVLWPEAGWKKVGMGELVLPNKVKIIYMKAIAKVHPDKIPQNATTEQRMISASVFSTLNEAWDKFKTDNGL